MAAFLKTLRSNRSVDKWVETANVAEIHQNLTDIFVKESKDYNRSAAITSSEISNFKKNIPQTAQSSPIPPHVIQFYSSYPFPASSEPLSHNSILRSSITLTGRDKAFARKSSLSGERVILRGRSEEDRCALLFRALVGAAPTMEDVLDVLALVQPRPNPTRAPLTRDDLRPMAVRLKGDSRDVEIEDLSIPKKELFEFLKIVGAPMPDFGDGLFVTFTEFIDKLPDILEYVATSAEVYFNK